MSRYRITIDKNDVFHLEKLNYQLSIMGHEFWEDLESYTIEDMAKGRLEYLKNSEDRKIIYEEPKEQEEIEMKKISLMKLKKLFGRF